MVHLGAGAVHTDTSVYMAVYPTSKKSRAAATSNQAVRVRRCGLLRRDMIGQCRHSETTQSQTLAIGTQLYAGLAAAPGFKLLASYSYLKISVHGRVRGV